MRAGWLVALGMLFLGLAAACGEVRDGSSTSALDEDGGTGGAQQTGSGGRAPTSGSGGLAPRPGSGGRSLRDAAPPPPGRDATSPGADVAVSPADAAPRDGAADVTAPPDAPNPIDAPFDSLTPVSFARDVEPIFVRACTLGGCHTARDPGQPPLQGMNLDEGAAYTSIVDVIAREGAAIGEPTIKRVDATNPDPTASYLWRKISTCCPVSGYNDAPPVGPKLTATEKEIIRAWIVQGALNN